MTPLLIQLWFPPAPLGALPFSDTKLWQEIVFCNDLFDGVAKALEGCRGYLDLPDILSVGIKDGDLEAYVDDYATMPLCRIVIQSSINNPLDFWAFFERHQGALSSDLLSWARVNRDDALEMIGVVDTVISEGGPDFRDLVAEIRAATHAWSEREALSRLADTSSSVGHPKSL